MRELSAIEISCVQGGVSASCDTDLSFSNVQHHNAELDADLFDDETGSWPSDLQRAD